jgi:two-component system, chemotaxis family, protein-glutamate methylesterase/glutaminase
MGYQMGVSSGVEEDAVPPGALVVIGASAGGVEALRALVAGLPPDLDAAVLAVLHIPRTGPSALPKILGRAGPLPCASAVDGEPLRSGRIYVAPADHHLLVLEGRVRLSRGPAENGHRPAVDPLFRSAARLFGDRTVAVVLSGARDDGTAGAATVAARGGRVLVQDPDDALHPSMPRSVIEHVGAERICPAAKLGPVIAEVVAEVMAALGEVPVEPRSASDADAELAALETAMANMEDLTSDVMSLGPAGLACPSCHGALFELAGEPTPRYRCWVGHAWSPQSLLDEQAAAFEGALWMALRSLEEKASLARRLRTTADERGDARTAERYETMNEEAEQAGRLIRELIARLDVLTATPDDVEPIA